MLAQKCYNFEVRKTEVSVYARTSIGNVEVFVRCESHFCDADADFVFGAMIEDMQTLHMITAYERGFMQNCPIVPSEPIASFTYEEDQIEELLIYHAEDAEIDIDTIDFNAAYNVIGEQFKAYHIDADDPHTEYFYGLIERYFEEHIAANAPSIKHIIAPNEGGFFVFKKI